MSSFLSIPGPSGTIQIGEVTVLTAGEPPTVTNTGTPWAAILNFGLPRAPNDIVDDGPY